MRVLKAIFSVLTIVFGSLGLINICNMFRPKGNKVKQRDSR